MRGSSLLLFLCWSIGCLSGSGVSDVRNSDPEWTEFVAELKESLPQFFYPSTALTKPLLVGRLIAEWEPQKALVISLPLKSVLQQPQEFSYYGSLISVGGKYLDIVVLHNALEEKYVDLFLKRLREGGIPESILSRVRFQKTASNNYWIRDCGPIFAHDQAGGLLLFDNIYRSLRPEIEAWMDAPKDIESADLDQDLEGFEMFRISMRNEEVIPMYLGKHIRQRYQYKCDVVRPPLHLQGGDFIADRNGLVMISEDTLTENGGSLQSLKSVFETYYGAKELHVLNALPGINPKHLDMHVKLVGDDTILLADPIETFGPTTAFYKRLAGEVAGVIEANETYIRRHLPHLKILKVPLLPVVEEDVEFVKARLSAQIFAEVCSEIGISYLRYYRLSKNDPQKGVVRKKVREHLDKRFGRSMDLSGDDDLDAACQLYFEDDLSTLIDTSSDTKTVYRSYLNSLQIVNESGKKAFIIPSYAPRASETKEAIEAVERRVESIYKQAVPDAGIHWINADVMTNKLGAIHCTTLTLPAIQGYEDSGS